MLAGALNLLLLGASSPEDTYVSTISPEDAYLSFTSRSHLVSAGTRLAWLEERRGIVNVVGCDANTKCVPQNLTHYTDGDGIAISQLTFGDDGKTLLYTRAQEGGVDATSAVEPLTHTTFAIHWQSPAPIAIAPHVLVATTPSADRALFAVSSGGYTSLKEATTDGNGTLKTLLTTAGSLGASCNGNAAAVWSPVAPILAFSITRLDHAFVGVWRRGTKRIRWLGPSMDTDGCLSWSPDGKSLAWVRLRVGSVALPPSAASAPSNDEAPDPPPGSLLHQSPSFSVMVASIAQKAFPSLLRAGALPVREVFREDPLNGYPGTGENGYGARPLLWTADGASLLFGSERSGFLHVLAANASGNVAHSTNTSWDVTPMACEHQGWTTDGDSLYVAHSCGMGGDVLAISRVDVRTGQRLDVTNSSDAHLASGLSNSGAGMLPLPDGSLAFIQTAHNVATRVMTWRGAESDGGGAPRSESLTHDVPPAAFAKFVRPQLITFPSLDGTATLHAQLYSASPLGNGGGAAAIFTHGGSERQMYGGEWPSIEAGI